MSGALIDQGNPSEALPYSLEALRLNPNSARAYSTVSELAREGHAILREVDLRHMQTLLEGGQQSAEDASRLGFALGAHWEGLGNYDEAFRYYRRANDWKWEAFRQKNRTFDRANHHKLIDRLMATFNGAYFARVRGLGSDSDRPLFIVGMPRSGTTLVEQILASHPRVFGAGELPDIGHFTVYLPQYLQSSVEFPECVVGLDPGTILKLSSQYLKHLGQISTAADRVVDKMPHNFLYLGLIALLFPRARIVHCRRDPRDVSVSTYCQDLASVNYSTRLEDIGFAYRQYERIMDHWRRELPSSMHEVVYEELVADQEAVSRKLLEFCGLEWDDRCLAFHTMSRPVATASKFQVRKPINTRSVARWKRFEAHLKPLMDALAGSEPA